MFICLFDHFCMYLFIHLFICWRSIFVCFQFPLRTSWNGQTVKLTEMLLDTDEGFEPSSTHIKGITAPTNRWDQ